MGIEEAESILKHLGFTEYESKTYMSLVKYGPLTAEKISKFARIPLPRVYDTMAGLARRGLVYVINTRPQTFRVNDPKNIFELLKEDKKKRMDSELKKIEESVPKLLGVINSIEKTVSTEEKEDVIAYIRRKANREKIWFDLQQKAKREVEIFAGDMSWIDRTSVIAKKMIKSGVKYRVILSKNTPEALKNAAKAKKLGMEVRFSPEAEKTRGIMVDSDYISLTQSVQEGSGQAEVTEYVTITIRNEMIIDMFKKYFNLIWKQAKPADKVIPAPGKAR